MVPFRANLAKMMLSKRLVLLVSFGLASTALERATGAEQNEVLNTWLAAQTNIHTWAGDLVETRTLKSLARPLTAKGRLWFAAPNSFRWELGEPPRTIAVRASNELLVIYPALKRVERFPLTGAKRGSWQEALGLLEVGFPRSKAELEARYNIIDQTVTNQTCRLVLQPKSPEARKMIPQLKIEFDRQTASLGSTELEFADGSILRNDFTNPRLNPELEPQLFSPPIPNDYKIVEPLKTRE
jgi:outer membrane lipoprotein-sorting protein